MSYMTPQIDHEQTLVSRTRLLLRESGYTPSQIRIAPIKRFGARLLSANMRFDNRGARDSAGGRYRIVSVESTIGFVTTMDRGARQIMAALD